MLNNRLLLGQEVYFEHLNVVLYYPILFFPFVWFDPFSVH